MRKKLVKSILNLLLNNCFYSSLDVINKNKNLFIVEETELIFNSAGVTIDYCYAKNFVIIDGLTDEEFSYIEDFIIEANKASTQLL